MDGARAAFERSDREYTFIFDICSQIFMVSNCPRCQIVRFYTWCQIVRGVKLSWCQIVLGVKLSANMGSVKLSAVSNCPGVKLSRNHMRLLEIISDLKELLISISLFKFPGKLLISK